MKGLKRTHRCTEVSNANIGEIIIDSEPGWLVDEKETIYKGAHGFNPFHLDMQVPFFAIGPQFKQSYHKSDIFQNTAIYPLLCRLLNIEPAPVDGHIEEVSVIQILIRQSLAMKFAESIGNLNSPVYHRTP